MRIPVGAAVCGAAMLFSLAGCDAIGRLAQEPGDRAAGPGSGAAAAKPPKDAKTPARAPADALAARKVLGGSQAEVTRFLGEPGAVRNDPPALVWEYAATVCKLDVFFYFDIGNKDFRALAYKFYPELKSAEAEHSCLRNIRSAKSQ